MIVKPSWEKMELFYRGNIAEMIQIGGGKLTRAGGDPGESRKVRGAEGRYDSLDQPVTFSSVSESLTDHLDNPLK